MLTLSEMAGSLGTTTVVIRGEKRVTVHALSAAAMTMLGRMYPRPVGPMIPNPNAGSMAPKIEDLNDPAFRAALAEWIRPKVLAELCLAVRLEGLGEGEGGGIDEAALREVAAAAERVFTDDEVQLIVAASRDLRNPERVAELLGGASGATPGGP